MSEGDDEWFGRRQEEAVQSGITLCPNVELPVTSGPPETHQPVEPAQDDTADGRTSSGSSASGNQGAQQGTKRQRLRVDRDTVVEVEATSGQARRESQSQAAEEA